MFVVIINLIPTNMKISQALIGLVAVLALVFSIVAINVENGNLAGTSNFDALDVTDGYKVDGITVIDGSGNVDAPITSSGDGSFAGGTLDVTTANTATSTIKVGCIQYQAGSSTATAIKLTLGITDSTATTTFYGGTSKGAVYWEYGTCPNL